MEVTTTHPIHERKHPEESTAYRHGMKMLRPACDFFDKLLTDDKPELTDRRVALIATLFFTAVSPNGGPVNDQRINEVSTRDLFVLLARDCDLLEDWGSLSLAEKKMVVHMVVNWKIFEQAYNVPESVKAQFLNSYTYRMLESKREDLKQLLATLDPITNQQDSCRDRNNAIAVKTFATHWTYVQEAYGLVVLDWNPKTPFDQFEKLLERHGPTFAIGFFGRQAYCKDNKELIAPQEVPVKGVDPETYTVLGWPGGSFNPSKVFSTIPTPIGIVVVATGLMNKGAKNETNLVFYIDPRDDSKANEPRDVYVMSYGLFTRYASDRTLVGLRRV